MARLASVATFDALNFLLNSPMFVFCLSSVLRGCYLLETGMKSLLYTHTHTYMQLKKSC